MPRHPAAHRRGAVGVRAVLRAVPASPALLRSASSDHTAGLPARRGGRPRRYADRMKKMKAVIPAAGLGTRFLPATKAMPKEMLPVVDKPAIQYVVEEAVSAGIDDILVIIGRNKNAISDHFDSVPELEVRLQQKGDQGRLERVTKSSDLADIHFVRQGEPKGLGHAVLRARTHVGDSSFAVLLGDDLIDERDSLLTEMIAAHERTGAAVVALMEVDAEHIHMYGVAAVDSAYSGDGDSVKVTALV